MATITTVTRTGSRLPGVIKIRPASAGQFSRRFLLIAAFLDLSGLARAGWPSVWRPNPLGIDVGVYNPARVPIDDLIRAKAVAAHIFADVRIKVMWVAGLMFSEVQDKSRHQDPPPAADLEVRIFTRAMLKPVVVAHDVLGITLVPDGPSSTRAVVIYDNILENARLRIIDPIRLLGLTIVHEVGHLLLQGHSPVGIMQARWLAKDLADRRGFLFTRAEADSMRSEVKRRMEIHLARRE